MTLSRFSYWFAGRIVRSNVELEDLAAATGSHELLCQIDFERVDELGPFTATFELVHWDELIHSQQTDASGTTLRFNTTAEFAVSADLSTLTVRHTASADGAWLRHTLLDQVLPRVASAQDLFVLHASGIETPSGAVLFLGDSGAGKSTLAASFTAPPYSLLGDDCFIAAVERGQPITYSTYQGLRLLPASVDHLFRDRPVETRPMATANPKVRVMQGDSGTAAMEPARHGIRAIFVIDHSRVDDDPSPTGRVRTGRLDPRQALIELVRNSFRLDINGRDAVAASIEHAAQIAENVPVYWIDYERDFDVLAQVHDVVFDHLKNAG